MASQSFNKQEVENAQKAQSDAEKLTAEAVRDKDLLEQQLSALKEEKQALSDTLEKNQQEMAEKLTAKPTPEPTEKKKQEMIIFHAPRNKSLMIGAEDIGPERRNPITGAVERGSLCVTFFDGFYYTEKPLEIEAIRASAAYKGAGDKNRCHEVTRAEWNTIMAKQSSAITAQTTALSTAPDMGVTNEPVQQGVNS